MSQAREAPTFPILPGYSGAHGTVLHMHELACSCGSTPTHVIFRHAVGHSIAESDFGLHVRGWCDDCSPAVNKQELAEERANLAAVSAKDRGWRFWSIGRNVL